MQWQDEGIVLKLRPYGEANTVLEVLTYRHGRRMGLIRATGRSKNLRAFLQPGNLFTINWNARLEEHLGFFQIEPITLNAARLMANAGNLFGLWILIFYLSLLPERDPHPRLYEKSLEMIAYLDDFSVAPELMAWFELLFLEELGFALDLKKCVVTGKDTHLTFVSPKSGCAVSQDAGEPWKEKLLPLPEFLVKGKKFGVDFYSLEQAFSLTGFFLNRYVYEARRIKEPFERLIFLERVKQNRFFDKKPEVA